MSRHRRGRVTSFQADRAKRNRLKLAGWLVLEFTWDDVVGRPDHVLGQIRQALAVRAA